MVGIRVGGNADAVRRCPVRIGDVHRERTAGLHRDGSIAEIDVIVPLNLGPVGNLTLHVRVTSIPINLDRRHDVGLSFRVSVIWELLKKSAASAYLNFQSDAHVVGCARNATHHVRAFQTAHAPPSTTIS